MGHRVTIYLAENWAGLGDTSIFYPYHRVAVWGVDPPGLSGGCRGLSEEQPGLLLARHNLGNTKVRGGAFPSISSKLETRTLRRNIVSTCLIH